ncbi:MAG: hypothetical protein Q7T86_03135 [Hyphomicrobiaceae bacterium]|nr:hypothetical protein [Hyphomicrobiaceae bacterium]
MPRLNFLEYRPDVSDLNSEYTRLLSNVLPRGDGYGPMRSLQSFTDALPGTFRGGIVARLPDSTVFIFAATDTRLYQLDNTTLAWVDVSQNGDPYGTLSADANWRFAQFNNIIIATQKGAVPQKFDITTSAEFEDLGGSPPQAGDVVIVGPFVVLSDLVDDPGRVQWCGLNAIETWDGTNSSDFQDLADGGRARCVISAGGDVGLIFQDSAVRRMAWAAGDERVFLIDKIENADGILAPYSAITALGGVYCLSSRGFICITAEGAITPIGEERVNRTFLGQHGASAPAAVGAAAYDEANPQLVAAAGDPNRPIILWPYKSQGGAEGAFDRVMAYHTTLQRWSPLQFSGEGVLQVSQPGLTLEALDAIAPGALPITGAANNGSGLIRITVASTASLATGDYKTISGVGGVVAANGSWTITVINGTTFDLQASTFAGVYTSGGVVAGSLDAMTFSLDDISTATLPALAAFDTAHRLGFFTGDNLEAEMTTSEQALGMRRMNVDALWPITDADTAYCALQKRDKLNGEATEGDESLIDADGRCPMLDETRYARAKMRIPAGTDWSFATGVDPEVYPAGEF